MLEKAHAQSAALSEKIIPDRVHPGPGGHLIMAEALLKSWNAPALVSDVTIDTQSRTATRSENAEVTAVDNTNGLRWQERERALPMPVEWKDDVVALAVRSSDFLAALDHERLRVTGLASGNYALAEARKWVMRGWVETAGGHHEHARALIRPVLDGSAAVLLPASLVDAWLLETSIAVAAGERPAARRTLQNALALAEPLDALSPFVQAGPGVRELLVHQHGSFGASDDFADRALAAGPSGETPQAPLSERELTVLGLLPSMLSLDEIAADLTVSVNTVKSHVRSIYAKLGVSSRRLAVLAAHEHGLLNSAR
jgi:LuxR family maltose regulon positive regulatory protein